MEKMKKAFLRRSKGPTRSVSNQGSRFGRRAHGGQTHRAAPSIPAGAGTALVHLRLAVGPRVPRPARASVASLARVGAGGPVLAGLVVCAVVQVCEGGDGRRRRREAQG